LSNGVTWESAERDETMIGIALTSEQIRAAPPEVRRWVEREVMAAFGQQS